MTPNHNNDNNDSNDNNDNNGDDDGAPPSERAYDELCGPSVFVDRLSYLRTIMPPFNSL